MSEPAAERPWIPGKNGGRLRPGGTHGPTKAAHYSRNEFVKALKKAGGWKFFYRLATGNAEDRRVFAQIAARLFPVELRADVDTALTVVVQKFAQDGGMERTAHVLPPVPVPLDGTCVIGENGVHAPIDAPKNARSDDLERDP